MSIEHICEHSVWLWWCEAMNNRTVFTKAPNEQPQIKHNMVWLSSSLITIVLMTLSAMLPV